MRAVWREFPLSVDTYPEEMDLLFAYKRILKWSHRREGVVVTLRADARQSVADAAKPAASFAAATTSAASAPGPSAGGAGSAAAANTGEPDEAVTHRVVRKREAALEVVKKAARRILGQVCIGGGFASF